MIGDKKIINNKGFSLIEMLVSVAVFVVLILIVTSIFQSVIKAQRNAIAAQSVQESMRFALELISKELRSAKHVYNNTTDVDECLGGETRDNYAARGLSSPSESRKVYNVFRDGDGENLYFKNKNSTDTCVTYYIEDGDDRLYIRRGPAPAGPFTKLPITPDEVAISNFEVIIDDDAIGEFHDTQAVVTIKMHAEMKYSSDKHPMDLQTTISSRYYE